MPKSKTRNSKLAGYEHTKNRVRSIVNGRPYYDKDDHPLPDHVTSKEYYDQNKADENHLVQKAKPGAIWKRMRKANHIQNAEAEWVWWPMNEAAMELLAAMSDEERQKFMKAPAPNTHKQECESKAILNGSKIKSVPSGKKEADFFPLDKNPRVTPVATDGWTENEASGFTVPMGKPAGEVDQDFLKHLSEKYSDK